MTSPKLEIEEGRAPLLCQYCDEPCQPGATNWVDDHPDLEPPAGSWARDNDGAYHWRCLRASVDSLAKAHQQHRSSDVSFLRSLGRLTEAHDAMKVRLLAAEDEIKRLTGKVRNAETHLARHADAMQPAVFAGEMLAEIKVRLKKLEDSRGA